MSRTLLTLVLAFCTTQLPAEEVLDASNLDVLRSRAGTEAAVRGNVVSIGTTTDKNITFLNIGAPKKEGFVAVIFGDNYASFPEGFEKYRARTVIVRGAIELFRSEQPQIVLRSPDQITVVEE
jgi:hypothetical protein